MKNTLTLTMIVKNETGNLPACLASVQGLADEIIIVDTGSTDNTLEIARQYTAKIYSYRWDDDFSAARNFAISKATSEWILSLDADEELYFPNGLNDQLQAHSEVNMASKRANLRDSIAQNERLEAYFLPLANPISASGEAYNRFYVLRLFRNNGRYYYSGKIHEQIMISEPQSVGIAAAPLIRHKPLPKRERNRKRSRNLALLKKAALADPDNYFLKYYLGVEWLMLGKPAKALPFLQESYQNLNDGHLLFRSPALRYLIISLHALGRLDDGICLCLEASLRYPDYTDIFYLGGALFEEKKEYGLAVKWFNAAVHSGTPPPLYSHLCGSGSFLAFHHLGYCYEMLGQQEKARECYEQSLVANPEYIYPVYSLFVILLADKSPQVGLACFHEKGLLHSSKLALTVADLFSKAGYPDLAYQCLEAVEPSPACTAELWFALGKYAILSGDIPTGLKYFKSVSQESSFYLQACIYKALAFLFVGSYTEARAISLKLWQDRPTRCEGYALLKLSRQMQQYRPMSTFPTGSYTSSTPRIPCAEYIREKSVLNILLELYTETSDSLLQNSPSKHEPFQHESSPPGPHFHLVDCLESLIKATSPRGYLHLLDYFQSKAQSLQSYFEYKFKVKPGG